VADFVNHFTADVDPRGTGRRPGRGRRQVNRCWAYAVSTRHMLHTNFRLDQLGVQAGAW